jgi:hypothetical protein
MKQNFVDALKLYANRSINIHVDIPILGFHLQKRMLRGYLKSKNLNKITKWRLLPRGSNPIALRFAEFINTEKSVCTLENVIKSEAF